MIVTKALIPVIASVLVTVALTGFRLTTPGPGPNIARINGQAYVVLHAPSATPPSPQGSRLTVTTEAPVGQTTVVVNGITYRVQGTPPIRPHGARVTILAPSTLGVHTAMVDGLTYAVRP